VADGRRAVLLNAGGALRAIARALTAHVVGLVPNGPPSAGNPATVPRGLYIIKTLPICRVHVGSNGTPKGAVINHAMWGEAGGEEPKNISKLTSGEFF